MVLAASRTRVASKPQPWRAPLPTGLAQSSHPLGGKISVNPSGPQENGQFFSIYPSDQPSGRVKRPVRTIAKLKEAQSIPLFQAGAAISVGTVRPDFQTDQPAISANHQDRLRCLGEETSLLRPKPRRFRVDVRHLQQYAVPTARNRLCPVSQRLATGAFCAAQQEAQVSTDDRSKRRGRICLQPEGKVVAVKRDCRAHIINHVAHAYHARICLAHTPKKMTLQPWLP